MNRLSFSRLRRAAAALVATALLPAAPAFAIVGGGPAPADVAARTVMIVSTRGASCTGTVLARDLILTAAHCVGPKADYAVALVGGGAPQLIPALRVALNPGFDAEQFRTRRPTPDLALVKLAEPLPARFVPATLAANNGLPARGASFLIAGYGMTADGAEKTAGTLRAVPLASVGNTGGIMTRLSPAEGGGAMLAGACTGDSGGPAFEGNVVSGVIGWVTAPNGARGCGGVTGITLVGLQRGWIIATARSLGSPVGD
ncbi:trypsin-like serine protease [Aquabacter sp. CN5-332]|uniref:S1 family peptidase n=1 Tax=Aquabacter sp. CN5-332 TaxID=3156608 RepID=UPI0032B623E6